MAHPILPSTQTQVANLLWRWTRPTSEDQKLHLDAFFSWGLSPAEVNYDVGNRELLAVVIGLQEWRHLVEGAAFMWKE